MAALAASMNTDYTLYTAGTPNGWKASICLEELGLNYGVHHMSLGKGEQKEGWYLSINPNGRIPALGTRLRLSKALVVHGSTCVDHSAGDLPVFESGAILQYLAERDPQHRLLPQEGRQRAEVMSWLFWQMGGLGPMGGQADWFLLMAPQRSELGIGRYVGEVDRLLSVMDRRLEGREWLAAEQYSIADIAAFPWVLMHDVWGVSLKASHPNVRAWVDRIKARPAVQRGLNVPGANMVLQHTDTWRDFLGRAQRNLEGIRPFPEPEE